MILMEIRIMEIKNWIRGNKWLSLTLIGALATGAIFSYMIHRPTTVSVKHPGPG